MGRYKALKNLKIGEGKDHVDVKKGHVFECDDAFADEHLNPLDADEEHHPGLHHEHHVQETDEPVTAEAKAEAKKTAKLSKAEKKAAEKAAAEEAKAAKKAEKGDK